MSNEETGVSFRPRASSWSEASDEFIDRPPWHDRANCGRNGIIGDTPEARIAIMFPGKGTKIPRWVCEGCPVRADCAEAGKREKQGVWGGQSERQRRYVRATHDPAGNVVWPAPRRERLLVRCADWTLRDTAVQMYAMDGKARRRSAIEAVSVMIRDEWLERETLDDGTEMVRAARRAAVA